MKILVVEDDRDLCDTLFDALQAKGFTTFQAYNGLDAMSMIYEHAFEMLILDINLPGLNGFEILREAKKHYPATAALFMTALDTPEHIEQSFQSGCDDYIRKPFSIQELYYRIEAVAKRLYRLDALTVELGNGFSYNIGSKTLFKNKQAVPLKPKLTQLMHLFATHPAQTITRETIEERLWENEELPDSAILRIYIKELRALLGHDTITTLRGVGYKLENN
jgi:DNA-binding response OmpR family regulator